MCAARLPRNHFALGDSPAHVPELAGCSLVCTTPCCGTIRVAKSTKAHNVGKFRNGGPSSTVLHLCE